MRRAHDVVLLGVVLVLLAASVSAQELTAEQAEKLTLDAVALYRSGDSAGALANLDRALAFYRQSGDREGQEQVLYARGAVLAAKGEHAKALESFAESLAIIRAIGGKDETTVLHDMAMTHLDMSHFAEAAEAFEQERAAYVKAGDRKNEGEALFNLGFTAAAQRHDQQALELLTKSLEIRREVGDREGEARTLETIAFVRKRLAPPEKPPTEKQRAQASQAQELNLECTALISRGNFAGALATCKRALELFRKAGHRGGEGMVLVNMGTVLITRGDYAEAQPVLGQALTIARETYNEEAEGQALNNLALISMVRVQYPQALTYLERALAIQRKFHDMAAESRTMGNLAAVRMMLGQHAEAARAYEQLLPRQSGEDKVQTLINLSAAYATLKQFDQARDRMEQTIALQRSLRSPTLPASLANLGSLHAELKEYAKAQALFEEALALDRKVGDRGSESAHIGAIGELRALQGEPAKALELLQQALALARELGDPTLDSSILGGIARIHESQGKLQQALDGYLEIITREEAIRATGQIEEIKTALAERATDFYQRAAKLSVRLGRPAEAFDLAERARGRTFLDQLGNAGVEVRAGGGAKEVEQERLARLAVAGVNSLLQQEKTKPRAEQSAERIQALTTQLASRRREYADVLNRLKISSPEYASLITVSPLQLGAVQKLLEPDTTLVSYFVTAEETLAFVVTRDAFHAVALPVAEKELAAAVEELRGFANIDGPPSPSVARLSAWLIAPLLPHIQTPLVGIIPHGVLHLLPFAALHGSDPAKPFGAEVTLFHLPTASALPFIQQKRKAARGELLALGQGRAEGLPPLRHAEKEAAAVAALFGTAALIGNAATETAFRDRAGSAGVIHIAAHGQLNAVTPLFSRLVLASDDTLDTARDGSLEVREIYGLDLKRASLVVLSACQTQLGAQSRGDDFVGLSRAFIYAGTPAVLASLWSVDDLATATMMTAFYRHLREGMGPAASLRAAQAETRAEHPDPYYWAAFVLTGNPR